ncbi:MAG: amidohydrolase family protein [Alphaproteobacteria bacterium]|nr:amidohydrolase family protein [Alphaproteobacteria bacterium]
MTNKLLTNVMIFDGTGKKSYPGEVLVQGNRIKKVAKGTDQIARNGAEVVNGEGATLMPGLVNLHGHLGYADTATLSAIGEIPPEENTLITMYNARKAIDNGITAVVSGASSKPRMDIVIRNEINAGRIPGPRLRAATPQIVTTGGPWDPRQLHMHHTSFELIADGPIEMRRVVREMIREGVDIVKLALSGDGFIDHTPEGTMTYCEDEIAAACEVAHSRGKRLAGHARNDTAIRACIDHGITFIYHASDASEKTLDALEKVKDKHYVVPAIGILYVTLNEAAEWGISKEWALSHRFDREIEKACATMNKMLKRGIRVTPYGDYGFAWNPHGADNRDLEHFVNLLGLTPAQTLMSATKWGGEGWAGSDPVEFGLVKEGFLADLLMVDGDPLADITLMQDRDNFLMIMKDGQYHKAPVRRRAAQRKRAAAAAE